jgi:hypothetical protein
VADGQLDGDGGPAAVRYDHGAAQVDGVTQGSGRRHRDAVKPRRRYDKRRREEQALQARRRMAKKI